MQHLVTNLGFHENSNLGTTCQWDGNGSTREVQMILKCPVRDWPTHRLKSPKFPRVPNRGAGAGVGVGMLSGRGTPLPHSGRCKPPERKMQATQAEDADHPSGRCKSPERKMQTTGAEDANHPFDGNLYILPEFI